MAGQPFDIDRYAPSLISPIEGMVANPESDTDDIQIGGADGACRAIYVGATGNVKITTLKGQVVTLVDLVAGVWHPIRASRIWSTDTTATGVVVGY